MNRLCLRASHPVALRMRGMAGAVKVQETGLADVIAPSEVARTEPLHEMGVLYPPGTPSPMEAVLADPPIIVDGLLAKTGGGPTGHPIEYIRLSAYDPTPVSCKYSGIQFVSKHALDHMARKAAGISGESEASVAAGVWPPGGPTNLPPPPKSLSNNTFGADSEYNRYEATSTHLGSKKK
eukprot:CAMPEP_0119058066 /NCGR_PEP_ID=MMETSP1178-20130426/2422_1 /TAXON_ID=33656 /ORGANISM="unid sp, Strain CCMP2000" /LENGTH=179 /DNA_ID=CAMNT_0007038959 /DNA_START=39 /DNA_END=578 /DNA_ORIENTATION=-